MTNELMRDERDSVVSCGGIHKTYGGQYAETQVLRDVDLKVGKGELVALYGKSGSGKTTLLNIMAGIDRASEGSIVIMGQDIGVMGERDLTRWRGRSIGVIFQFFQLLPTLTLKENVMLPLSFNKVCERREWASRAEDLLDRVGLSSHMDKLPSEVSGGEQQRAAIARALITDAPLLLADEPTGNLDTENSKGIYGLFQELAENGRTLVVVTHEPSFTHYCSRTIHLIDGRIVSDGDGTEARG